MEPENVNAVQLSADVARIITDDFLVGGALGAVNDFATEVGALRIDVTGLERLQEFVREQFAPNDSEADAWLAPRVHALLRLTRRQARNQGLWRWLSICVMNGYVRHRWSKTQRVEPIRYLGGSYFLRRNAIARLWWGAEGMRNGPDYTATEMAFRSAAIEQYVLDNRFGHLRASALAFARVAAGRSTVRALTFDETKELSKRVNLLLSATALESLAAPGAEEIAQPDTSWLDDEPSVEILIAQDTSRLLGPSHDAVAADEIAGFERWYAEVAAGVVDAGQS